MLHMTLFIASTCFEKVLSVLSVKTLLYSVCYLWQTVYVLLLHRTHVRMELPRQLCSYEHNATKPKHITYQLLTSCIAKAQCSKTQTHVVSDFTSYIDTYTEGII